MKRSLNFCLATGLLFFSLTLTSQEPITKTIIKEKDLDLKMSHIWQWQTSFNLDSLSPGWRDNSWFKSNPKNFTLKTIPLMGIKGEMKIRYIPGDETLKEFYSHELTYNFSFIDLEKNQEAARQVYTLIKESLIRVSSSTLKVTEKDESEPDKFRFTASFENVKEKNREFYLTVEGGNFPIVYLSTTNYNRNTAMYKDGQTTVAKKTLKEDITPANMASNNRLENLKADPKGMLYVICKRYPEPDLLLRNQGGTWDPIGPDVFSVEEYIFNKEGVLFVLGRKWKDKSDQILFKYENKKWKEIPVWGKEDYLYGIVVSPDNTLQAYGFVLSGKERQFNLAEWTGSEWKNLPAAAPNALTKALFTKGSFDLLSDNTGGYYIGKYESSASRSYFLHYTNGTWNLLDTTKLTFYSTIRDMAVDSKGNLYAACNYADNTKSYALAKWDNTQWIIMNKQEEKIETLTADNNDNIYFAGYFGPYSKFSCLKLSGNNATVFAQSENYYKDILFKTDVIVAISYNDKVYRLAGSED